MARSTDFTSSRLHGEHRASSQSNGYCTSTRFTAGYAQPELPGSGPATTFLSASCNKVTVYPARPAHLFQSQRGPSPSLLFNSDTCARKQCRLSRSSAADAVEPPVVTDHRRAQASSWTRPFSTLPSHSISSVLLLYGAVALLLLGAALLFLGSGRLCSTAVAGSSHYSQIANMRWTLLSSLLVWSGVVTASPEAVAVAKPKAQWEGWFSKGPWSDDSRDRGDDSKPKGPWGFPVPPPFPSGFGKGMGGRGVSGPKYPLGPDQDGKYTIAADGIRLQFIPYGASITNLFINDTMGVERDIVLGFDNATYYPIDTSHPHLGGVPGKFLR
jgi:hypothetical protein